MSGKILKSKFSELTIPDDVTISELFLKKIETFEDKVALIDSTTDQTLTYKDLAKNIRSVAGSLVQDGLHKDDVFFCCLSNCIEYPVILYSVVYCGAVLTTCNPIYKVDEICKQLKDSSPSFVCASASCLDTVKEAIQKANLNIKRLYVLEEDSVKYEEEWITSYSELLKREELKQPPFKICPRDDVALMPYSSGTSGLPKGVCLTHYNLNVALHQFLHPDIQLGVPGDVYVSFLPLFHMYGIAAFLMYGLYQGSTIVVMKKFNAQDFLTTIAKHKATILHIVPPVALFLTKHPLVDQFDVSSVKQIICAAAPLKTEISILLQERLNLDYIKQGYGMTELSPMASFMPPSDIKHGSAGIVVCNTEIKIVNYETNELCGPNENGEIMVKGPQVMKKYLNNEEATKNTIDKDGWLHTGDVGYYDEDEHLYVVDRIKELIKYNGFQVAPAELEGIIITHPAVADAAVIGIPDDKAGELPRAYVVLKPSEEPCSLENIQKYVEDKTSYFKHLRGGIVAVKEIPKSASGKILRRVLRESYGTES